MYSKHNWVKGILAALIFVPLFGFLFGWIVMLLWNALIPDLFHGPLISFWQAVGLIILSKLLFGKFGGHGYGCGRGGWRNRWKERMRDKWEHLSPEEKEKMRDWCSPRYAGSSTSSTDSGEGSAS